MKTTDYTTSIIVAKDATHALACIQNFRGWWSEEIAGDTDVPGSTFFYHYKDVHLCRIRLEELVANQHVVYRVLENEFSFTRDKTEWVNSRLIFELVPTADGTRITFTHEGLTPQDECYNVCNEAWTSYIHGSLKALIETGQGRPNAKEGGLNAELVKKWGLPEK